jgi:cAMP-dependent protein kinase regulator
VVYTPSDVILPGRVSFVLSAFHSFLPSCPFCLLLFLLLWRRIDPKAFAKKKSGGRRRRRSVVCSSSKVDTNWKPVSIPKDAAQTAEILQVISKNILFQTMTSAERKMLANVMSEKKFDAGTVIIKEGDPVGDYFYILSSGSIPITKNAVEGPVYTCKPGDAFGELALLYDAPRNATCKAGPGGAVCWALDRDSFKHLLRKATLEKRQRHEAFLKDVKILTSLSDYERGRLCDALIVQEVVADEVIVRQGEDGDHFYLIESGEFKVAIEGQPGEVCDRLARGAYFGEIALLTSKPRAATVTACQPGTLLSVHRDAFTKLLGSLNEILGRNMELYRQYSAKAAAQ